MGKYLSNGNRTGNGSMGVRTRAKAREAAAAAALSSSSSMAVKKKMKKASNKGVHLRNRRRIAVVSGDNLRPETVVINSSSSEVVVFVETAVEFTGGDDVIADDFPVSCCSSNNNPSISNNIDLELESAETTSSRHLNLDIDEEERIENEVKTIESGNLESTVAMRSRGRKSTVEMKTPSDSEIDAFFASAEKDLQKRFTDRYNFDVVKDEPLEGRYEWVQIKP